MSVETGRRGLVRGRRVASMGPRFDERGNEGWAARLDTQPGASMGPRFDERGNEDDLVLIDGRSVLREAAARWWQRRHTRCSR